MKIYYKFCTAAVINKVSERIEEEKQIRLDLSMVMRIFMIDFLLLIILTIIYFTCFGCFFIVSGSTQQSITLSSSGLANETYPESMGEYQPTEAGWYRHVDRDDRFLTYNKLGNIKYSPLKLYFITLLQIIDGTSPLQVMKIRYRLSEPSKVY